MMAPATEQIASELGVTSPVLAAVRSSLFLHLDLAQGKVDDDVRIHPCLR